MKVTACVHKQLSIEHLTRTPVTVCRSEPSLIALLVKRRGSIGMLADGSIRVPHGEHQPDFTHLREVEQTRGQIESK